MSEHRRQERERARRALMEENGKDHPQSFIHVQFAAPGQMTFQISIQNVGREQWLVALESLRVMVDDQIRAELQANAQRQPRIAIPNLAIRN
jgi:hypothetical protein